jgi:Holliday junction resolvase
MSRNRNLLLLFNKYHRSDTVVYIETEQIKKLLEFAFTPSGFCIAHELAKGYRIINNNKEILAETQHQKLKPFCFLINKN